MSDFPTPRNGPTPTQRALASEWVKGAVHYTRACVLHVAAARYLAYLIVI